jgi:hypothetical protein
MEITIHILQTTQYITVHHKFQPVILFPSAWQHSLATKVTYIFQVMAFHELLHHEHGAPHRHQVENTRARVSTCMQGCSQACKGAHKHARVLTSMQELARASTCM